jgi:hypothetical protein
MDEERLSRIEALGIQTNEAVVGLFHLMGLNPNNKPRTQKEVEAAWSILTNLMAKKSWTSEEMQASIEMVWYMSQEDLRCIETKAKKKLAWLPLFRLFYMMKLQVEGQPDFKSSYKLKVLESRLRGVAAKLEYQAHSYLLRFAPELKEAIENFIYGYMDNAIVPTEISSIS